jgi:hypothetical protein
MLVLLDDCHSKTQVSEDKKGNISIGSLNINSMASGHHRLVEFTQANNLTISAEEMIQEIKFSLESRTLKLLQTAANFINEISAPEPHSHR